MLNAATSPATTVNACDKLALSSAVNAIPCNTCPDVFNKSCNSKFAKPALFANSSTNAFSSAPLSPNTTSNADPASLALEAKSTISLPTVTAATDANPNPATVALPIAPAALPNVFNAFCPFVNDLTNWSVLPTIAIDTFFSNAII